MKTLIVKLFRSSFVRYAFVGCLGLVVDMGLFYVFYELLHVNYVLSNIVSSSVAVVHNFLLNTWITFKVKDKLFVRFLSFYSIALVGMALSSGMLALMIDVMHLNSMVSKAIAVFVVALLQYYVNKHWTFGEKKLFSLMNRTCKNR
jgi:putative flippase GtrA